MNAWIVRLSSVRSELQALHGQLDIVPDLSHKVALIVTASDFCRRKQRTPRFSLN